MRVFTAGNELNDYTADEFQAYNVVDSPTFNQPGGPRTPQGQGGNYYFYLPNTWGLRKDFQTGTMQVANGIRECYIRFHFHCGGRADGGYEMLRILDTQSSGGAVLFSLRNQDLGGGGNVGGPFFLQLFQGANGTNYFSNTQFGFRNDVWHKIELYIKMAASGGQVTLWVNDVLISNVTGAIVGPGVQTSFAQIALSCFSQAGGYRNYQAFDNIAVNAITDGTGANIAGAANNGRCGNGYLIGHLPANNGASSQLQNDYGNNTNNFNHVNQLVTQNPTTFVGTNTPNTKDTYKLPRLPEEFRSVNVVKTVAYAVRNGTAVSKAKFSLTPTSEAEILLPTGGGVGVTLPVGGYGYISQHFETNTNTGNNPFTPAEYNGAESGIQFIA